MEKKSVSPTKMFLYLAMMDAFVYMCPAVYATFLSAFYTQKGLTGTQTGILFGISPLMYILVQPHWARLADRTGKRREILCAICIGCAVSLLGFYLGSGFWAYLPVVLMLSSFSTAMVPVSDSIILIRAGACKLPFSYIRLGGTLGYIAVVLLCGRVFTNHPEWMFAGASLMFFLYALTALFLPGEGARQEQQSRRAERTTGIRAYVHGEFLFVLLFSFCGYVGLSFCTTYVGSYLVQLGYDRMTIAIASVFSAVSEIPVLLLLNRHGNRIRPLHLLLIACLATGLRTLLTGSGVLPCILAAQLLQGPSYMLMYYCCVLFISSHLPEQLQSSGQSLLVLVQSGCGSLVGFIVGGRLIDAVGIHNSYMIYGTATLVGALVLWVVLQFNQRGEGESA